MRMLRWFPSLQVATARFSCSSSDLNFLDPYFIFMLSLFRIFMYMHSNHCHRVTAHLQLNILLLLLLLLLLLFCITLFMFLIYRVNYADECHGK